MGNHFKPGANPKAIGERWQRRRQRIAAETGTVASRALSQLRADAKKHDFQAKRVSKQDSGTGKDQGLGRAQVFNGQAQTSTDSATVKLWFKGYFTGARGKAVKDILTSLGRIGELFRKFLWVKAKPGATQTHKVSFAQARRLAGWAARADRGSQYLRHVIKIKGEALKRLALVPILRRNKDKLLEMWRQATKRGLHS